MEAVVMPEISTHLSTRRIDYIVPIPRGGTSGRSKASTEKAAALLRVAPGCRTFLLGAKYERRPLRQLLAMLGLEVRYFCTGMGSRQRPDAIITRSPIPLGAYLVGMLRRVPLIKEIHTDMADEAPLAFAGRPLMKMGFMLLHHLDVWSARRADGLIFNNTVLERHFLKKYLAADTPTVTVPNGTNVSVFRRLDRQQCRKELGLASDRRYLVWVGAINPWHGVERILALADVLPSEYEVLIVGKATSSYARSLVEGRGPGRARMVGAVPPEMAARYINAADACLLTVADVRVSPGSPLKLFDYAACGTPVICQRDTEGYSDIVCGTGIGVAVDFNDPAACARDIDQFIPASEGLRDHVREVAEREFSWEERMRAWLGFVDRVRSRRRR